MTSLGAGREDNWAKLTAGQSGIREITRFATDGLKTRIAGTVDFVPIAPSINAPELSQRFAEMAGEEAIANPASGRAAIFPARSSSASRRSRSNGSSATRSRSRPAPTRP